MGKLQRENGFMLYAKDLKRKYERGDRHIDWDDFKNIASDNWLKLNPDEKSRWKLEAKQAKADSRKRNRDKHGRPGSDDSMCGERIDEVDILEKLPKKQPRDTKKLLDQWTWDFDSHPERQKDKRFLMISCQYYYQEFSQHQERSRYFPAEIAVVEWSLNSGVLQEFHHIIPLKNRPITVQALEDMEHRTSHIHGIGNKKDMEAYSNPDSTAFEAVLSKLLAKHTRIYCFHKEYLEIGGILDWFTSELNLCPVLSSGRLVCIEDLFWAMVKWDKLDLGLEPDDLRDLHSVVRDCSEDWGTNLCHFHVQAQLGAGGDGDGMNVPKPVKLLCSMALVRGVVSMIREWILDKSIDQAVFDMIRSEEQSRNNLLDHSNSRDRTDPLLNDIMGLPLSIGEKGAECTGSSCITGTDGGWAPAGRRRSQASLSSRGHSSKEVLPGSDEECIRSTQVKVATILDENSESTQQNTSKMSAEDTEALEDIICALESKQNRAEEKGTPRGNFGQQWTESGHKTNIAPEKLSAVVQGVKRPQKFNGITVDTSQLSSEKSSTVKDKSVTRDETLVASGSSLVHANPEVSASVDTESVKEVNVDDVKEITWESIQRAMPPDQRGIGRGLSLFDWNEIQEVALKALSGCPNCGY